MTGSLSLLVTGFPYDVHREHEALLRLFGMGPQDYKRFLNFLRTFGCEVPFHAYREPGAR